MTHRLLTVVTATFMVLSLCAADALAHGGQFRGPHGAVPPGLRAPSDPTPPPIPSPDPGPITPGGQPSGGQPSTPGVTPPSTGVPNQPATPGTGTPRARPSGGLDFTDASFWWGFNKEPFLEMKRAIYHRVGTESPLSYLGRRAGNRGDNTHDIRSLVKSTVLPNMLWTMDPKNNLHSDIESAGYIGLAKIATSPEHIEMLKRGLLLQPKNARGILVQESAALAFGLLRRTDETEQFTSSELDNVRDFCFSLFENSEYRVRVRGFAAISLGLLGDQPTGRIDGTDENARAQATTARLFELLKGDYANEDLYVALFMAIGQQPTGSITTAQRDVLRDVVLKGKLFSRELPGVVRAHATTALGRIGTKKDIQVLRLAVRGGRASHAHVRQSAAIGLGELSQLVSGPERVELVETLLKALKAKKMRDQSARNFAYIALGQALSADVKASRTDVIEGTKVREVLLSTAEKGRRGDRNFAALALAIVSREIGEKANIKAYGDFRSHAFDVLRLGVESTRGSVRDRANFAAAVGMAGDITAAPQLLEIVQDEKAGHELRGYSALALGLLGDARKTVIKSIRKALRDKRSEEMRIQCATALGLLHDDGAVPQLLKELHEARSQSAKGQLVLALARIGDARAVQPLVDLLRDPKQQNLARAVSCAALGVVGDLEPLPSLSRLSVNVNYRATTDLTREVLSII